MGTHRHLRTRAAAVSVLLAVSAFTLGGVGPAAAGKLARAEAQLNSAYSGTCAVGTAPDGTFGTVRVTRLPDNRVIVWVRITDGLPNETYMINVTCKGAIGTVTTDETGRGTVSLPPTDARDLATLTNFVIDVHVAEPYADPATTSLLSLPLNP